MTAQMYTLFALDTLLKGVIAIDPAKQSILWVDVPSGSGRYEYLGTCAMCVEPGYHQVRVKQFKVVACQCSGYRKERTKKAA